MAPAAEKSQAKITQFVINKEAQRETPLRADCRRHEEDHSNSQDEFSTAESENSDDETVQEYSELSAESPEIVKPHHDKDTSTTTKRKQKSQKRPSKKK